jgi:prolyl 4-hydroxylase
MIVESKELATCVLQYDFPETLSKAIINLTEQVGEEIWEQSGIGNEGAISNYRTSSSFDLDKKFPLWDEEVRKYFVQAINDYSEKFHAPVSQDEGFQLLRYRPGNEYKYHSDGDWESYRSVSALIYLNPSEYTGGETFFKHFNVDVKPDKPAIVVFPSNYAYYHSARPVLTGQKYVLVTWMNDMPIGFRPNIIFELAKITNRI